MSIKTSPRMKVQLLDQQIESQLLAEFAPKLVQVVFNDGSSPVKTRSSGGPIVSFAVDEGGAHMFISLYKNCIHICLYT